MAGMENIYDILAKENEQSRQAGIDYSKIREGGVAAAVMAQAGGMLGGSVMQAAGFKTAAQKTQEGREQLQQMHPNPTTYQDMVAMANDAKNLGLSGDWEKIMNVAENMKGSTDMKKWQYEIDAHKQAIYDYAKSKGYTLSPRQLDNLVSSTKSKPSLNQLTGTQISGFTDIVDKALEGMKPDKVKEDNVGDINSTGSVTTGATQMAHDKYKSDVLGKGFDDFKAETNKTSDSIGFNTAGLLLVDELDAGQSAALPPLKKALSTLIGDDRISMMEIQQATKIGDIGQRMTDWFSEFASGDLSPETKAQIRSLFRTLGKFEEKKYNSKVKEYKDRYPQFKEEDLNTWFTPKETSSFYTPNEIKLKEIRKAIRRAKGAK
jgi:hypothetical protein